MRAVCCASPAYFGTQKFAAAHFAAQAFAPIYQQMVLVIALVAFAVFVIAEGCAAVGNALRNNLVYGIVQAVNFFVRQGARRAHRQNAG